MRPLPEVPGGSDKQIINEHVGKYQRIPIHSANDFLHSAMASFQDSIVLFVAHSTSEFICIVGEVNLYLCKLNNSSFNILSFKPIGGKKIKSVIFEHKNNPFSLCIIESVSSTIEAYSLSFNDNNWTEGKRQKICCEDRQISASFSTGKFIIIAFEKELVIIEAGTWNFYSTPLGSSFSCIYSFPIDEFTLLLADLNCFVLVNISNPTTLKFLCKKKFSNSSSSSSQLQAIHSGEQIIAILNDGAVYSINLQNKTTPSLRKLFQSGFYNVKSLFVCGNDNYLWIQEKYFTSMIDINQLKCVHEFSIKPFVSDSSMNGINLLAINNLFTIPQLNAFLLKLEDGSSLLLDGSGQEIVKGAQPFLKHLTVNILTWNVAATNAYLEREKIVKTVEKVESQCDILVIGLQEIVDINSTTTNALEYFNGDSSIQQSQEWTCLFSKLFRTFRLVGSSQMLGIYLAVFCRKQLMPFSVEFVPFKTGLNGMHGNKGAVSVRFCIENSSFCFVCMHLPAGHGSNFITERNIHANSILKGISYRKGGEDGAKKNCFMYDGDGTKIFDHGNIFVFGDLNYRLEIYEREQVFRNIQNGTLQILSESDELGNQMKRNPDLLLKYLEEHLIEFNPTYKFDRGESNYDSSNKMRVPAWTDRVLYLFEAKRQSKPIVYKSIEENFVSDHRPVFASFTVYIK